MTRPLWTPSRESVAGANLTGYTRFVNDRFGKDLAGYDDLYAWSITQIPDFWESVWEYTGIRASVPYVSVLEHPVMPGAKWFEGARLNFAENLLSRRDEKTALIFVREGGEVVEEITYAELYTAVAAAATFFKESGVKKGDRVAGFMPNRIEAVVSMLAAASLGAVWSSCSPDFGFKGVMDRFGQIRPKVLVACDGYFYNGKKIDTTERVARVEGEIDSIEKVVVVPFVSDSPDLSALANPILWSDALESDATQIDFVQFPFDHPLYIMYSSGTTGVPKCIVHGAGGTLLQHAKELILHTDLTHEDTIFYFTTCGWMMWNWLVSSLCAGSAVVLYDGSPTYPNESVLWKMAQDLKITVFGTSAKYISTIEKSGLRPGSQFDLSDLRAILSTGSPLSVESFHWVYEHVKLDLQLASIAGGTDIVSCFMLGSPIDPVYPGEIQKRGLGMKVEAWNESGKAVTGEKAELVCTEPFPSMPVSFWSDPDGSKYHDAYFTFFPGVWHHGDYIEITDNGGVVMYGRSDATLNPGGVRIGTSEIDRQVENMDEVMDSVVVGQAWEGDVRIVLFVVLRDGLVLDEGLMAKIREQIRSNTTPRHVPARIIQVPDIPRTLSGKKVEIAVTRIIHGEEVSTKDALANPKSLAYFEDLEELKS